MATTRASRGGWFRRGGRRPAEHGCRGASGRVVRMAHEPLERRALLAVGPYDVPQRDLGDYSALGVVDIDGGCSGTLLADGRHVIIAAHCLKPNGAGGWRPTSVTFWSDQLDSLGDRKYVTVSVPSSNIFAHPSWNGGDGKNIIPDGSMGIDIAVLELPVVAPFGNGVDGVGFQLRDEPLSPGQVIQHVGFGHTGTGTTGQAVLGDRNGDGLIGGDEQADLPLWGGQAEIQRLHVRPGTTGSLRLSVGADSVLLGPAPSAADVEQALAQLPSLAASRISDTDRPARVLVAGGAGNPFAGAFEIVFWNQAVNPEQVTISGEAGFDGQLLQAGETLARHSPPNRVKRSISNTISSLEPVLPGLSLPWVAGGPLYAVADFRESADSGGGGQGDSGGPVFVEGQLAGVNSYSTTRRFGGGSGYARISAARSFIDATVAGPYQLSVDLSHRLGPADDGVVDSVVLRVNGGSFELLVGDYNAERLYYSDLLANLTGIAVYGSRDSEIFRLDASLFNGEVAAVPIVINGADTLGVPNYNDNDLVIGPDLPAGGLASWSLRRQGGLTTPDGGAVLEREGASGRLTVSAGDVTDPRVVTFVNIKGVVGGQGDDAFVVHQDQGAFRGVIDGGGGTNAIDLLDPAAVSVSYTLGAAAPVPAWVAQLPAGLRFSNLQTADRFSMEDLLESGSFTHANAQTFRLVSGPGAGKFGVTPSAVTAYSISAAAPTLAGPGRDELEIDFAGLAGRRLTNYDRQAGSGVWTFAGAGVPAVGAARPVTFSGIEKVNFFPVLALGAVAGPGRSPVVQVIAAESGEAVLGSGVIEAYEPSFRGGVSVATGDLDGDGVPELVTAPGAGRPAELRVFDLVTGAERPAFRTTYSQNHRGGTTVTVGDVDGDGLGDLIAGPALGAIPVRVFRSLGTAARDPVANGAFREFFPISRGFAGGVSLAAADFNADGRAEVVVGSGIGIRAVVNVFDLRSFTEQQRLPRPMRSFQPFKSNSVNGLVISVGHFNADNVPDIAAAHKLRDVTLVDVLDGSKPGQAPPLATVRAPDPRAEISPIAIAARDVDKDGIAELHTAHPVAGSSGRITQWKINASSRPKNLVFKQHPGLRGGYRLG